MSKKSLENSSPITIIIFTIIIPIVLFIMAIIISSNAQPNNIFYGAMMLFLAIAIPGIFIIFVTTKK